MTRILCLGDSHFGVRARAEQCHAVHDWFAELVHSDKPDLVLHSGDVFDALSRPDDRRIVADWLTRIAEVCPVVIAKGGGIHDRKDDAAIMARLRTKHPVIVQQQVGIHRVAGVTVAALGWPETAWLAAATNTGGVDLDNLVREALRNLLRGLGAKRDESPTVFLSHLLVDGSRVSEAQELVGAALNVGLADLALARADAYVLGHVHLPQLWCIDGNPCFYTGSPFPKTWGETEQKSIALLLIEQTGPGQIGTDVERIPTPAAPLVHFETTWTDDGLAAIDKADARGAECRLRYQFPADHRAAAERQAAEIRDDLLGQWGAESVKLEPVVTVETRTRLPEVAQARTLPDQLEAYWRSVGFDPGQRRAGMLAKLRELEDS